MINVVTHPDFVDTTNHKILLIDVNFEIFHLILSMARTLSFDVDFYLSNNSTTEWLVDIKNKTNKTFKTPTFDEVATYLKGLNEG